jgi:hypothetical protein
MRDTTQWRKDADRFRQRLLAAYRAGDVHAIANATQALEVLLRRADRPVLSIGQPTAAPPAWVAALRKARAAAPAGSDR